MRSPTRVRRVFVRCGLLVLGVFGCIGTLEGCQSDSSYGPHRAETDYPASGTALGPRVADVPSATRQQNLYDLVPPQSLPSRSEELWVIEKPGKAVANDTALPPGTAHAGGALLAQTSDHARTISLPLARTDVTASIAGYIATVTARQQFRNPLAQPIEASYIFPLPQNAAVSEFMISVGPRRIRGIIRERNEAREIYGQAKALGYVVALLQQRTPNAVVQSVANIQPGHQVDVEVQYFHTLPYRDGAYEFSYPLAGMRPARSGPSDATAEREISLTVNVEEGVPLQGIESPSHAMSIHRGAPARADIELAPADRISDRDFLLRIRVAGSASSSALIAQGDQTGGYFTMMLVPPAEVAALPRQPQDMIFAVDVSPEMADRLPAQAKALVRTVLQRLGPDDTFQIVRFAQFADRMDRGPIPATPKQLQRADRFLDSTPAISAPAVRFLDDALKSPHQSGRLRVVWLLSTGRVGDEVTSLRRLHDSLGDARVFSFGLGFYPNRSFLDEVAKLGRGAAIYLDPHDDPESIAIHALETIRHPALTDVVIDWAGLGVCEVFPSQTPDLFVGRPVTFTGRFKDAVPKNIKVRGKTAGAMRELVVPITRCSADAGKALTAIWARLKIAALADRAAYKSDPQLPEQIRTLALEHGLLSAYTSFITVDSLSRTESASTQPRTGHDPIAIER